MAWRVCSSIRVTVSDSKSGSLKSGLEKPTPRAANSRAKYAALDDPGDDANPCR